MSHLPRPTAKRVVTLLTAATVRRALAGTFVVALLVVPGHRAALGDDSDLASRLITSDSAGELATVSTNDFDRGSTDGFFAKLGTNGRTCNTCHLPQNAWTFTPEHARRLPPNSPLFTPNDGSDCPPLTPNQGPDSALSSQVLTYGLIRVQIAIPGAATFSLVSATNPKACAIPPGSPGVDGQLFLFRRPLPSTNLIFDSAIMFDGRETLEPITTQAHFQSMGPLLFDLADQANSATTGHAEGASIVGTQAQADIVTFETNIYTAQALIQPRHGLPIFLNALGGHGGPAYIQNTLAPAFAIGVNDPLKPGFTNANFTLFAAWEPTSPLYRFLLPAQQAIGRGEAIFNNTRFTIRNVAGLNSDPDDPLYNPSDPLAGQDIVGGCAVCHNSPNIGNHSTSLPINIGVTMANPVNNDGSPNTILDIANLPVYTLQNAATSATVKVTDPGKAMISGKWTDIGKTKGPILRGLAGRAPYFHNGSASDLTTVVHFYNARFNIGLTPAQVRDLVAFLSAL
jgi:cytochrome c peroxidase